MNFSSCFELESSWTEILEETLKQPYLEKLADFIEHERQSGLAIYPSRELVFNAFNKTPFEKVNVVIMGQDPYHGAGQAHGLSFSVPKGVSLPPSLRNVYKELVSDLGIPTPTHGCLESWAEQGVLLLNATLTVRQDSPLSHHGQGWELFTDAVIEKLSQRTDPVIFVLWGKYAQEKCGTILHKKCFADGQEPLILTAPHPSPFSAYQGFFGCRHFSKINQLLLAAGKTPINWEI